MPKYKNISNNYEVINNIQFPPNKEIEVEFYTSHPNLKLISDDPVYTPVQYSEVKSSGSVKVTENLTPEISAIRIVAKSLAVISINSSSSPEIVVTPYQDLLLRPVFKYNEIFIKSGEVSVELWKEHCWRN